MCLLIALFAEIYDAPLIMAANRDERYARAAVSMTVLRDSGPRVLGGRDQVAGGTWLAVSEHGVVAGLTNKPSRRGRDTAKRSRGELPLAFAAWPTAAEAVAAACATLRPDDYNPCWLLVGDRHSLYSVSMEGGARPEVRQLPPGLHVLENVPLGAPSAKAAWATGLVARERAARPGQDAAATADALAAVLRDHEPAVTAPAADRPAADRPAAVSAACVHTSAYGTRSATIVVVPAAGPPRLRVADGPSCQAPLQDMTSLWNRPAGRQHGL